MEIVLASLGFAVATLCAAAMGLAIQRGATCTVVAVEEVLEKRSARRLAAMVEASLWVTGGLLVAEATGLLGRMPAGYPLTVWTLVGGALLGLGAFVNGACVFGAIARLGKGEWAYLATPLGFWLGCLTLPALLALPEPQALPGGSPVLRAPPWTALLFLAFAAWRLARPPFAARRTGTLRRWLAELAGHVWAPHAATTVIAIAFVIMLLLVGAWSYTDALAGLARGMRESLAARMVLFLALLLGAVLGGWLAGRPAGRRITLAGLLRCTAGGMLMAWGGLLVPGSNDGLILLAMPLLFPYAWVAFFAMCAAIAAAKLLRRGLSVPRMPVVLGRR